MTALDELYRKTILDHNKNPRHYGELKQASHHAAGNNPLCGDEITVYLDVQDHVIQNVGWTCSGCAISKASTSVMMDELQQQTVQDALKWIREFISFMKVPKELPTPIGAEPIEVLAGVKEFPVRIKCALLGWKTAEAALAQQDEIVTTESGVYDV